MIYTKRVDDYVLCDIDVLANDQTIFTTFEWVAFLKKNQHVDPVILELSDDNERVGFFVGLITKKLGLNILGSPFEGWLTPDMGFIRLKEFNINEALSAIAEFAFKELKCWYILICDKKIVNEELEAKFKVSMEKVLHIDLSTSLEAVRKNFTKNGRRDISASERKGSLPIRVPFDEAFVEEYYKQLIDVFGKQNLKPFYDKKKLLDLVEAFKEAPDRVLALEARLEDGTCAATVLSFGFKEWAYYAGAASYREYQKYLPNERLFWAFVEHWHGLGALNLDLMGVRPYKMKYNPNVLDIPFIYFERIPGLHKMKNLAKRSIMIARKIKGKR